MTFAGATEVDKQLVPFLSVTQDIYQGGNVALTYRHFSELIKS